MFSDRLIKALSNSINTIYLAKSIYVTIRLPISARKIIITSCQTMEVEPAAYQNIFVGHISDPITGAPGISHNAFLEALAITVSRPVSSSILWMFARSCPEPPNYDESSEVAQQGFEKEFLAAQTLFNENQQVSYSAFFRNRPGINDPGQWWIAQAHKIRDTFTKSMDGVTLFPVVQRSKNVSYSTASEFNLFMDCDYVRTLDLELLYAQHGIKVGGQCEMRSAWKFNDLKPRLYYCIGGEQYWASSYMKVVAVKLMEAIPSTSVKIRTSPTDYLSSDLATDYVMAWDFSSFTTTLSELKYFLWYVARILERAGTTVKLFSYRDGFITANLWELIDEYNDVVNMNAGYSIHRLLGKFFDDNTELDFYQMNSGMLGVPGNIGFSTALHGLVVCKECGTSRCVCVGDDALGITPEDPHVSLSPALKALGIINLDKFALLHPGDQERYIKFLKRRVQRVGDTFTISFLLNVPIAAYIDGEAGIRTKPLDFSIEARLFKFCTSVSTLLWDVWKYGHRIPDEDIDILDHFLTCAYKYLRLPFKGMFPGQTIRYFGEGGESKTMELGFVIPPIPLGQYDPRKVDWLEYFTNSTTVMFFRGPMFYPKATLGHISKGMDFVTGESVWLSAMEDLGYVRTASVSEWILVLGVDSKRVLQRMIRKVDDGFVRGMHVVVLKDIPDRYFAERKEEGFVPMDSDDI